MANTSQLYVDPAPEPETNGSEPCMTGDPERFFPRTRRPAVQAECKPCHVREACLAYAITHDVEGIWGGSSYRERETFRRENHIRPNPVMPFQEVDNRQLLRMAERGASAQEIAIALNIEDRDKVARRLRLYRKRIAEQQQVSA